MTDSIFIDNPSTCENKLKLWPYICIVSRIFFQSFCVYFFTSFQPLNNPDTQARKAFFFHFKDEEAKCDFFCQVQINHMNTLECTELPFHWTLDWESRTKPNPHAHLLLYSGKTRTSLGMTLCSCKQRCSVNECQEMIMIFVWNAEKDKTWHVIIT